MSFSQRAITFFLLLPALWMGAMQLSLAQVAVPALSAHVTDLTSTLTAAQQANLEKTLQDFEEKKGSQIAVLIVATTAPETIEQFALRVAEQWKLGRKKIDDGALLIVAKQDRAMRIEVGYGLEGVLNDAVSKRIISDIITPKFKQDDFYLGISEGVQGMMQVITGESLPVPKETRDKIGNLETFLPMIIVFVIVLGGVLRALLGPFPGAVVTGGLVALLAWSIAEAISLALIVGVLATLFSLMGGRHGFFGAYRGGSRGGSGGGGFHGGGGGFGGGGASGRW